MTLQLRFVLRLCGLGVRLRLLFKLDYPHPSEVNRDNYNLGIAATAGRGAQFAHLRRRHYHHGYSTLARRVATPPPAPSTALSGMPSCDMLIVDRNRAPVVEASVMHHAPPSSSSVGRQEMEWKNCPLCF